ncbi:MAG TPA: lamin tail domain-containing protein [Kaistella chaponensis]|jgi:hypothetical protein|nr:lamin tail domain-containing protein [Kaistella chaponensis]
MKKIFTILGLTAIATMSNAQIVISEVYGGGGGSTAVYMNDFVELVNLGSSAATLSGANLQYASATGTFNSYAPLPSITLNPGQKFLIEMVPATANPVGAALPTADYKVTSNLNIATGVSYNGGFNMSAANGKIALANAVSAVTAANGANVVDFIGYGSATMFEGAAAAPLLDATKSATRTAGDTNNNGADFAALAPTPTNSVLAVSDVNSTKITLVKNSNVNKTIVFGAKANVQIISANGQVVKTAVVSENTNLDVSSLPKGMYIISADVNGQKVSQKIIKN